MTFAEPRVPSSQHVLSGDESLICLVPGASTLLASTILFASLLGAVNLAGLGRKAANGIAILGIIVEARLVPHSWPIVVEGIDNRTRGSFSLSRTYNTGTLVLGGLAQNIQRALLQFSKGLWGSLQSRKIIGRWNGCF